MPATFATTIASVPVGIGMDAEPRGDGPQAEWVKEYDLGTYPGKVHRDGVQALIDTIKSIVTGRKTQQKTLDKYG